MIFAQQPHGNGLPNVVVGVFGIILFANVISTHLAYTRFLRLLQQFERIAIPTFGDPSGKTPIVFFSLIRGGGANFPLFFRKWANPEVEKARKRTLWRFGVYIAIIILTVIIANSGLFT